MKNLVKKIIRTLLDVHDYMTADELARIVNVSVSSIKHNIKDVREELKKYDIELLSIPRKGFCLDIDNSQRALTLQEIDNANSPDSFSFRKNYILDTLFQYNSVYTIQLFADEIVRCLRSDYNTEDYRKRVKLAKLKTNKVNK